MYSFEKYFFNSRAVSGIVLSSEDTAVNNKDGKTPALMELTL